jgi:DnaJ-class molecular chaperone
VSTLTLTPLVLDRVEGEPTLDDLLAGVWEGLSARRAVRCPVCHGEMEPLAAAGERGGHCDGCGATLS